jgi:thioredoxin 1
MFAPILASVVKELDGVTVESINATEQRDLAQQFNVTSVPTLVVLKDAKVIGQRSGLQSRPLLKSWLEELLNEGSS